MAWAVTMEEDGTITLPPDLIAKLGWTPETLLAWTDEEGGISLSPISRDDQDGSGG